MTRASWLVLVVLLASSWSVERCSGRILNKCDAAKELNAARISRSFIGHYVCVMKSVSNFNTALKKGPGHKASYSYGIFQISSDKWCSAFRPGGVCNKKCTDFLDDDIQDDIACAKKIVDTEGFKYWSSWCKSCKENPTQVADCKMRSSTDDQDDDDQEEEQSQYRDVMLKEITDCKIGASADLDQPDPAALLDQSEFESAVPLVDVN